MTHGTFLITNTPRDYAWGIPGGISAALGWPATDRVEAELWLGSHPAAPSKLLAGSVGDLAQWEGQTGNSLPYLMKLLASAAPLSLQAHPTDEQARVGFARENAAGIELGAPNRNYKDPNAKPEIIVALEDGFQALCGFQPVAHSVAGLRAMAEWDPAEVLAPLITRLESRPIRQVFDWLLANSQEVQAIVDFLANLAQSHPSRFGLTATLATNYPGDPGVAIALLMNHETLAKGESLWLPAGTLHAYISGIGIEVMGPSDNVLRGGLTPKHIDQEQLAQVLDFATGPASRLLPLRLADHVVSYRPATHASGAGIKYELLAVTGPAVLSTGSAATALVTAGEFEFNGLTLSKGQAAFATQPGELPVSGAGEMFVATAISG